MSSKSNFLIVIKSPLIKLCGDSVIAIVLLITLEFENWTLLIILILVSIPSTSFPKSSLISAEAPNPSSFSADSIITFSPIL